MDQHVRSVSQSRQAIASTKLSFREATSAIARITHDGHFASRQAQRGRMENCSIRKVNRTTLCRECGKKRKWVSNAFLLQQSRSVSFQRFCNTRVERRCSCLLLEYVCERGASMRDGAALTRTLGPCDEVLNDRKLGQLKDR